MYSKGIYDLIFSYIYYEKIKSIFSNIFENYLEL